MNKRKAYTGVRADVAQFVDPDAIRILDVGCSNGTLGSSLKTQNEKRRVVGLEGDQELVKEAQMVLDQVEPVDLNLLDAQQAADLGTFECIIFADVLEHVMWPEKLLSNLVENCLEKGGNIIISLPNVSHYLSIVALLKKSWPKHEHGLFDKTHIRWFGWKDIEALVAESGLSIISKQRNCRMVHDWKSPKNRWTRFISKTPLVDYITYQYVVNATRN